jgi:cyclopropane fatty-acyl-phospholipid synthase-like methyltransferase
LTSRAREGFTNIEARAQPIQLAFPWKASLRSAVVARIAKSELAAAPPHVGPVGMRFSVPDLRASVPAHGKLTDCSALPRTEGGWWVACPNEQRSLVPPPASFTFLTSRARGSKPKIEYDGPRDGLGHRLCRGLHGWGVDVAGRRMSVAAGLLQQQIGGAAAMAAPASHPAQVTPRLEPEYPSRQPAQHRGPLRPRQRLLRAMARRRYDLFGGTVDEANETLEAAQRNKLDRVIDLMAMAGGERVLEIGCGWGSLARRMTERFDCAVTALTLSTEQLAFAQKRQRERPGREACEFRLQDYRDVSGTFDRIVSIEMLEAVGEAYWPTFFATLRERLHPGGIAVLQAITIDDTRFADYRRRPDFIQKYIFPGGMLPTPKIIQREIARAGLQLVSNEVFGASYAHTLEQWHRRFQAAWPAIERLGFDERFKRMWEYYLAYCRAGFEARVVNVGLFQVARPG